MQLDAKRFLALVLAAVSLTTATQVFAGSGATNSAQSSSQNLVGLGEVYELSIPKKDTRATLLQYLQNVKLRSSSHLNDGPDANSVSSKLMRSYRYSSEDVLFPINSAPFPRYAVFTEIDSIYSSAYDATFSDLTGGYEPMMDALMQEIETRQVPDELKFAGHLLGKGIAKRVLGGKSPKCVLDPSPTEKAPSIWTLLLMKIDFIHVMSDCEVRTIVYNELKTKVNKLKLKFPSMYHKEFLATIHDKVANFPQFVSAKFQADVDLLWGTHGSVLDSLVEETQENQEKISLGSFAADLRTDLAEASLLIQSSDKKDRGLATALFYSAANRLLIIMGGSEASWNGHDLIYKDGEKFDKKSPKKAPVFAETKFGGWGASLGKNGPEFSPWDWSGYSPSGANPTPLRLFPSEFVVDANGVAQAIPGQPMVQKLDDLADVLLAAVDFLAATAPSGPFGKYFIPTSQLGDILHEEKPGFFPREGRMLAMGLLGGIAQNLIVPALGYIEQTNQGLHLVFHDSVTFDGRASTDISMRGISHLLMAAGSLRQEMANDPDMPDALKALAPQLDTVLQFGAIALGMETQLPGGNFKELLYSSRPDASLESTIVVMRGIMKAYNTSGVPILRIRLEGGWKYLMSEIAAGHLKEAHPDTLWELENLWEESQIMMRPNYPDRDWGTLEKEMDKLRSDLNDQMATRHGPVALGL